MEKGFTDLARTPVSLQYASNIHLLLILMYCFLFDFRIVKTTTTIALITKSIDGKYLSYFEFNKHYYIN